jgi:Rab GDP dissociation inhibitor
MLNKPITKIVYNEQGEACGVQSEGETARAKFVVGGMSWLEQNIRYGFFFFFRFFLRC